MSSKIEFDKCYLGKSDFLISSSSDSSYKTQLTFEEVDHLCSVMLRAKKFDEEEAKKFEGQLSKYTNVVKGWQYRWFVIDHHRGILEYYMLEDKRKPRGCITLAGCQIIPSEEDSQTFTVNAACGDIYKLKAIDAKDRQVWVDNLRLATQIHENKIQDSIIFPSSTNSSHSNNNLPLTSDLLHLFDNIQNQLDRAKSQRDCLENLVEDLTQTNENLLLIKATSKEAISSLEQCFFILESLKYHKK